MTKTRWVMFILPVLILACIAPPWVTPVSILASVTVSPSATLTPKPTATRTPTVSGEWTAIVSRILVNVRDEPGGAAVGTLESGQKVKVIHCIDNWCKIKNPGDSDWHIPYGWVWRGCLSPHADGLGCSSK